MQCFKPASKPTLYFIGVTTSMSSIMTVFPLWADALRLGDVEIKGIDLPLHAPSQDYRDVVDFIKNDPLSLGALVTTHKLDLFNACHDLFDYIDPFAEKLEEVSSLSKRGKQFCAHAKDPISSGLALEHFVPRNFWSQHGGSVALLGAGGSSLAMSLYFSNTTGGDTPSKIIIANRSEPRLESAEKVLAGLNSNIQFSYVHNPSPEGNDQLIKSLPEYSLIVNATGLGKDAPGSPTTDAVVYPAHSLVWEINYRGDLLFMRQALKQQEEKHLHVEDGWNYFIHGWTQVISEVFDVKIEGATLDEMSKIARQAMK